MQVKIDKPIMRVPMLAIHLNRTIGTDGFNPNKQTELVPILATSARLQLEGGGGATSAAKGADKADGPSSHHSALLDALAEAAGVEAGDIVDLELNCCDTQPGVIGGLKGEFVYVGRLDNLAMSWCSMQVRNSQSTTLQNSFDAPTAADAPTAVACVLSDMCRRRSMVVARVLDALRITAQLASLVTRDHSQRRQSYSVRCRL